MENKIKEVLDVLGLKVGEEYNLTGVVIDRKSRVQNKPERYNPYRLNDTGEFTTNLGGNAGFDVLIALIKGEAKATPVPFNPKRGAIYYWVDSAGDVIVEYFLPTLLSMFNLFTGNCFKTREEAENNKQKILQLFDEIKAGKRYEY